MCPLCGGESHQMHACPKMPIAKKVEVLVEKFDATGVTKIQPLHVPTTSSSSLNETWVTVSPKKRVKAMIQPKPLRKSGLKPSGETVSDKILKPSPSNSMPFASPAPLGPNDIILANPLMMNSAKMQTVAEDFMVDPLDALKMGVEVEANMDVFLNLQNFEDVEMSAESAKRKRAEDGDGASSKVLP